MASFQNVAPLPRVFPSPMMHFITKDPPKTADTQRKLMKVCKFFYLKHPIIPLTDVFSRYGKGTFASDSKNNGKPLKIVDSPQEYKFWIDGSIDFKSVGFIITENTTLTQHSHNTNRGVQTTV